MKIKLSDITKGKVKEEELQALQSYFKEGGTWSHLLELKPSEVEEVYRVGHEFYEEREFDKALGAFATLIQLNPYEAKYWIAIGASLQGKAEYEGAKAAYEVALAIEEENCSALFYSAQCAYLLEQREEARTLLEKLLLSSAKQETPSSHAALAEQILRMI